ncbi:hypothetical protein GGX14DRAFT_573151 [Mycena pura]|uniref:Uncharacterized protein n=1 Tax=Mycena pura TaxID=153505 RepID=A0AAD6UZ41_9AGAR|nr:hypothetical protein GGX14DRAFT_573151 [Mycena pura]
MSKKTDKGKKRATLAELANNHLLEDAKKVRCSFRDPETGLRTRVNKRKDNKVSASAGSEVDLGDLVRTPLQVYFHGDIVNDLLMRMWKMEFKVAQLELGQKAAGLLQIKGLSSRPGPSRIVKGEDVEMGEPEGELEPERILEVGQPENESRVEAPVGGEERPVGEGEPAIVPEEIEEEVQCDVPMDAPVEPQATTPVDVPEPDQR